MSAFAQDVRYTLRTLKRSPGFTLVAILTLALGIGGTTAIFSVVDGVVLRALPYPRADRLVAVTQVDDPNDGIAFSPADYLDVKSSASSLAAMAGYREDIVDLSGTGDPERLEALQVTAGFFDVFGSPALVGRTFSERTDRPDGPHIAVISEGLWRRRFGSRANIIGTTVRLNAQPTTIIGVAPATFRHPTIVDVWVLSSLVVPSAPVTLEGDLLAQRDVQYFNGVGRVADGRSLDEVRADLRVVATRLAREFPDTNDNRTFDVVPLKDHLVGATRTAMLVLLGAVAIVLLIACANVASLLLARGAGRRRELAVRAALGAGRGRLIRQLLTEAVVLASTGGLLGLLLSVWVVELIVGFAPGEIPRLQEIGVDARIAGFAFVCSCLVGMAFGVVPALQATTPAVSNDLKDGGRTGTSGRTRLRSGLVIAEVGLALTLLIGAGLLLTSFSRLRAVDPGFRTSSLVAVQVPIPQTRYDEERQTRFYQDLVERLRSQPPTRQTAIVFPLPLMSSSATGSYSVIGQAPRPRSERPVAEINAISTGYFETVGIPLLRGRGILDSDTKTAQPVVIVNRSIADREWPGRDPIGQRIVMGGDEADEKEWLTVVGVVADSHRASLQTAPRPSMYLSHQQFSLPFMGVVVRTDAGLGPATTAVQSAVAALDRDLPVGDAYTIEQIMDRSTGESRFRALLIAAFAAVAVTLAVVGIYGLISYTVSQRVPEIGVRLALGATPGDVRRLVLGDGMKLAGLGVAAGLIGAVVSVRALQGLLFAVSATSPLVYGGVSVLLLAVAGVACWIPARRAMRTDPAVALRSE